MSFWGLGSGYSTSYQNLFGRPMINTPLSHFNVQQQAAQKAAELRRKALRQAERKQAERRQREKKQQERRLKALRQAEAAQQKLEKQRQAEILRKEKIQNQEREKRIFFLKQYPQLEELRDNNFGIVKKMKKVILDKLKNVNSVKVEYSTTHPMLLFSFKDNHNNSFHYEHIRSMLKKVPALKHKKTLFDDIFGRLYDRVDAKYSCLLEFAAAKCKELKINFNKVSCVNQSDQSMFFYKKGLNKELNFVIFDRYLKPIEFDSFFIEEKRFLYKQEFKMFEEMYKNVFNLNKHEEEGGNDIFDKEQMESDEQDRWSFENKTIFDVRIELERYLNKDLSDFQEKIQDLKEQIEQEGLNQNGNEKIKRLTENLEDLQEKKVNYEQVRSKVRLEIINGDNQSYRIGLKKLIIAEKQLESKLPIIGRKRQIFQRLQKENLLIIEGETGSGKSTQLPQILCQYYQLFDKVESKPVLVAQPRRLATRSLAERVAKELGQNLGGFVDYMASAGKEVNPKSKIIFKLDRLVLDQLTEDPILSKYSCLVIDQAHERTISIDVILGLIKQLLEKRKDFKVFVTSASMDIQLFESYFGSKTLKINGRMFPVTIKYKDYHNFKEGDRFQMIKKIQKVIDQEILYDRHHMKVKYKGHLLCFCSGIEEITELVSIFSKKLDKNNFIVLPLHGKISLEEQKKVFEPSGGKHKFIFASKIAETAITIDGVKVVIDHGQDIELVYDQKYKISTMKQIQISQSSAKQRAGRSGRTSPGYCFRLYSEDSFKQRKICKIPEMENSSLEIVALRLKSLGIKDVINFPFICNPSIEGLKNSLQLLTLIGALSQKEQKITKIGSLLIRIPIDPFLSRAIVEGLMFERILENKGYGQILEELSQNEFNELKEKRLVTTITATLSLLMNFSNLFFVEEGDREKGEAKKFAEFSDEDGDFFFLANIYSRYLSFKTKGKKFQKKPFKRQLNSENKELSSWLAKNYLSSKTLNQTEELVAEIQKILDSFHIDQKHYEEQIKKACQKMQKCKSFRQMVLSCLITSFSPNLCKYSGNPNIGYTLVNQRRPVQIHSTSNLSLLGIEADWIICYDLYANDVGRLFCKAAHRVSFDFIKNHTNNFIQRRFNIEKIEEKNPFYLQLNYSLPTSILAQIRSEFRNIQRNEQLYFLDYTNPLFNEERNEISFFILTDQVVNQKEAQGTQVRIPTDEIVSKLKEHIEGKSKYVQEPFVHHYMRNVYISLQDNFQVNKIEFNRKQFSVQIVSIDLMIEYLLDTFSETRRSEVYTIDPKEKILKQFRQFDYSNAYKRIILFGLNENDKENIYEFIQGLKLTNAKVPILFQFKQIDHSKKIPKTKLLIHCFVGTSSILEENTMWLSYYKKQTRENFELLKPAIAKLNTNFKNVLKWQTALTLEEKTALYSIQSNRLALKTKKARIYLQNSKCDEFELRQYLQQMVQKHILNAKFRYPKNITKLRNIDRKQASKSIQVWRNEIIEILDQLSIPTDKLKINLKSRNVPKKMSTINETKNKFRCDLVFQLLDFDQDYLLKLKKAIDGKKGVLGSEKVHVRSYFNQVLAIPSSKVFEGLEEEYQNYLYSFKEEFPCLSFETQTRRIKNQDKTMIIAHSPNKQDFFKPQRILSALYTPKLIKLLEQEYDFLYKMQDGDDLMNDLQYEYKYKIYFGFQPMSKCLKVYCEDKDFKKIEKKIRIDLKNIQYYNDKISYKGKNLNQVCRILDEELDNAKKKDQFVYSIRFQTRQIEITGKMASFEKVKNALMKLSSSQKGECQICADIFKSPYKLINCQCTFCWRCISDHVRQLFSSRETALYCPSEECLSKKTLININDFKTLLPEQEFQKICDLKVKKYLEDHSKQTSCFLCKFCQNIIDRSNLDNEVVMHCEVCGKCWCESCSKEVHLGYTCEEWQQRGQISEEQLRKLGIKQCPNCKIGIQKNQGCYHVTCKKCQSHICWKCLRWFKTDKECYDHLAKECGGIN